MKGEGVRWAGQTARMKEIRNSYKSARIILKWGLKVGCEGVAEDGGLRPAPLNTALDLRGLVRTEIPWLPERISSSQESVSGLCCGSDG
jgi:hypothetical protein